MENFDFDVTMVLLLVVTGLLQSIPTLVVGFGGILCLRKGYQLSGVVLLVSVGLSVVNHVGSLILSRIVTGTGALGMVGITYGSQAFVFVANSLLAVGLVTLIRAVGKRSTTR